ncbi:MAG: extracellular solute-binding protein [Candidatus Izemoplasmatales bacterium]
MRRKTIITILIAATAVALFAMVFNNPFMSSDYERWSEEVTDEEYAAALELLQYSNLYVSRRPYLSFLEANEIVYGLTGADAVLETPGTADDAGYSGTAVDLSATNEAVYRVTVAATGLYHLAVDFYVQPSVLNNLTVSVLVDGVYQYDEARTIDVPLLWADETKDFTLDTYGDESLPDQVRVLGWRRLSLQNNTYPTTEPLLFYLEAGEHEIVVRNVMEGALLVGALEVVAPVARPAYAAYAETVPAAPGASGMITIDAIDYVSKNSSFVRLYAFQSASVTPFDAVDKKLNVLNGAAWYRSGQEVTYAFEVETAGTYRIALHYLNDKDEFSVFRAIYLDGEIPFEEFSAYEFRQTGGDVWANEVLGNEDGAFSLYLTAGEHAITFRAVTSPAGTVLRDIQLLVDHINAFALDILSITGSTIDENRRWVFSEYIPETASYLEAYDTIIRHAVVTLSPYSDELDLSSTLAYLKTAVKQLEEVRRDPDVIPLYLDTLYSGTGSITSMLGDSLTDVTSQPLYLDAVYVYNDDEFDRANADFFERLGTGLRTFFASFSDKKYQAIDDPEAVTVWVSRSLIYVDLMQKMADAHFAGTGIDVSISVMPDASKLILANAAGKTPDVALGLASYMPYDLSIRGALQNLTEFDDFWDVAGSFAPGAFIPYILEDGVYAFPETLDFNALVYRRDTMTSLGLSIPDTWDDVIDMLPTLQRNNMNFYYPTSGGTSLKWFYQTSSLIFQYGGTLYAPDGLSTTIDAEGSYRGLKLLADLYTTYSLPSYVASFYNSFRYNTLPIGVIDFATYLTLKNAAPELTGQWSLGLLPGVEDEDTGEIQRWFIANGSAAIMFGDIGEEKKNESWEFLKWWMSAATQSQFAFALQSTYGPEYVWLSGNLDAVANSTIDPVDKAVILEMVAWLADVPRTPGQYLLERGLSNVWNTVTFDGTPIRIAIDEAVIDINREIKKKMTEFGYIDADGNVLVPYTVRGADWVAAQIAAHDAEGGD